MKLKLLIFLLFPFVMLGQKIDAEAEIIRIIDSQVKYADSISSFHIEEVRNGELVYAHGRIDGKPTRRMYISTRILKNNSQVIRICYTQRKQETDEDMSFYYSNSKLIYAELVVKRLKKKKLIKKRFYYQNDVLISPTFSSKEYNFEDEAEIFELSKSLLKQASS